MIVTTPQQQQASLNETPLTNAGIRSDHGASPIRPQLPPLRTYLENHSLDVELAAQPLRPSQPVGYMLPFRASQAHPSAPEVQYEQTRTLPRISTLEPVSNSSMRPGGSLDSTTLATGFAGDTKRLLDDPTTDKGSYPHSTLAPPLQVDAERNGVRHSIAAFRHDDFHISDSTRPARSPILIRQYPGSAGNLTALHTESTTKSANRASATDTPRSFTWRLPAYSTSSSSTTTMSSISHTDREIQPRVEPSGATHMPNADADTSVPYQYKKRRQNLPPAATATLNAWYEAHASFPYPREEEKMRLVEVTGLEGRQVENWFINARRRRKGARDDRAETDETQRKA